MTIAPQLPLVIRAVARVYLLTGRRDEAEDMYLRALGLNEQDALALQGLALIRRREQRFDEAEGLMRKAIGLQPGNWRSINALGNMYFRMGRFVDAIAEYRKVVYLDPENFVTLGNLASANLMVGDFDAARDVLERSVAIEDNATFRANLGITHYYLGDFAEAIEAHRRAVELAPNSASSWIGLADALHFGGDKDEAKAAYEKTSELARMQVGVNRNDTESLMYLAWASAMTGKLDEAAAHASQAVELDPADPYSHYFDAIVKLKRDEVGAALDALQLAVDTGYPVAMLAAEPILKELQQNTRFVKLLANTE
jgi:Flp pilus assembly protein TadD